MRVKGGVVPSVIVVVVPGDVAVLVLSEMRVKGREEVNTLNLKSMCGGNFVTMHILSKILTITL